MSLLSATLHMKTHEKNKGVVKLIRNQSGNGVYLGGKGKTGHAIAEAIHHEIEKKWFPSTKREDQVWTDITYINHTVGYGGDTNATLNCTPTPFRQVILADKNPFIVSYWRDGVMNETYPWLKLEAISEASFFEAKHRWQNHECNPETAPNDTRLGLCSNYGRAFESNWNGNTFIRKRVQSQFDPIKGNVKIEKARAILTHHSKYNKPLFEVCDLFDLDDKLYHIDCGCDCAVACHNDRVTTTAEKKIVRVYDPPYNFAAVHTPKSMTDFLQMDDLHTSAMWHIAAERSKLGELVFVIERTPPSELKTEDGEWERIAQCFVQNSPKLLVPRYDDVWTFRCNTSVISQTKLEKKATLDILNLMEIFPD